MLICVIYSIIDNYVCIDYLACQSNKLSVMCMDKNINESVVIVTPYFLMTLLSSHGFMKNIIFTVILSCRSRLLEYHFSKSFVVLERNSKNLMKVANEDKYRIGAMDMHNS